MKRGLNHQHKKIVVAKRSDTKRENVQTNNKIQQVVWIKFIKIRSLQKLEDTTQFYL